MTWNTFKDKLPPEGTYVAVWRYKRETYMVALFMEGQWFNAARWYLDVYPEDQWMILPERKK